MAKVNCCICSEKIDRTDATKEFTIITVKGKYTNARYYLCDSHTNEFRIWANTIALKLYSSEVTNIKGKPIISFY